MSRINITTQRAPAHQINDNSPLTHGAHGLTSSRHREEKCEGQTRVVASGRRLTGICFCESKSEDARSVAPFKVQVGKIHMALNPSVDVHAWLDAHA
mmetsp:Transcript_75061/g.195569  ORF Transcript_75061/g.195569 Transcript_75061/m.195569 type:complete len:97 (-) Transcript_75061:513-803(-)